MGFRDGFLSMLQTGPARHPLSYRAHKPYVERCGVTGMIMRRTKEDESDASKTVHAIAMHGFSRSEQNFLYVRPSRKNHGWEFQIRRTS